MSQTGSSLSAVYQPKPAAGPSPLASYSAATSGRVPYEMPAVCVSRSRIVIGRLAGTMRHAAASRSSTATVVFANVGMKSPTGVLEADLAFLDEHQDGDAGDGLGLRRDAEDRVGGHASAGFLVGPADGLLVDRLAVLQDQCDDAGDLAVVDVLLHGGRRCA